MKRLVTLASVLALSLATESFLSVAYGHGGVYRGPSGGVPPSGRQPSDPTPAPAPNPGPTPGPAPAPGPTPGPAPVPGATTPAPAATPRASGGAGGTTGARRSGGKSGPGFEQWEFWWQYNKDALLNLKSNLYSGIVSGSSGFFLGDKGTTDAANTARPTSKVIEEEILPILKAALKDKQPDVRDSAVIALGKVGSRPDIPVLVDNLKDDARSVREASVLALGILGDKEATETLIHILKDDQEARKLRGGKELETRLRAMAAISLGLIGDERAVDALIAGVNLNEKVQDIPVCSAVGLGLMRNKDPKIVSTLISVSRDSKQDQVIRAHAVNSLGRIFQDKRGEAPKEVVEAVEKALKDKVEVLRRSAVLTIGLIAKSDDPIARLLPKVAEDDSDLTTRYWASISMGQIGGEAFRKELERGLGQTSQVRAYSALALGLQARAERSGVARDAEQRRGGAGVRGVRGVEQVQGGVARQVRRLELQFEQAGVGLLARVHRDPQHAAAAALLGQPEGQHQHAELEPRGVCLDEERFHAQVELELEAAAERDAQQARGPAHAGGQVRLAARAGAQAVTGAQRARHVDAALHLALHGLGLGGGVEHARQCGQRVVQRVGRAMGQALRQVQPRQLEQRGVVEAGELAYGGHGPTYRRAGAPA